MDIAYGMIRGTGKQAIASQVSLLSYLIGLPFSYCAAFYFDLGIIGLYSGITVATSMMAIGFTAIIFCISWPNLFQEVRERKEKIVRAKSAGNYFKSD